MARQAEWGKFNDGIAQIYETSNEPPSSGNEPEITYKQKYALRYRELTVGVTRYWQAMQNGVHADLLISCPQMRDVSTQDIVILNSGRQYQIKQVQYPEGITPPEMNLTLEKVEETYSPIP